MNECFYKNGVISLNTNLFNLELIDVLEKRKELFYKFKVKYRFNGETFYITYNKNLNEITAIELDNKYIRKDDVIISKITSRKYDNCILDISNNKFLLINIFRFLVQI